MTLHRPLHLLFTVSLLTGAASVLWQATTRANAPGDLPATPLTAGTIVAGGLILMAVMVLACERVHARTGKRGPLIVVDLILPVTVLALEVPAVVSGGSVAGGQTTSMPLLILAALLGATGALLTARSASRRQG